MTIGFSSSNSFLFYFIICIIFVVLGDLRTQLRRKRAAKQNATVPSKLKVIPTRLLKNALEGAILKKSKKSKSAKYEKEAVITGILFCLYELS